jgi:hypothetical protein
MKIRPVGAELLLAGGWTDRHDEAVIFRYFANAPKQNMQWAAIRCLESNLRMIHYNIKMYVCHRKGVMAGIYLLFYIHISVHRNIIPNYNQQDATFLIYLFLQTLYIFQAVPPPIIRNT